MIASSLDVANQFSITMSLSKPPHILLVNPWIVDFAAYDFWAKPLGLLMISNLLRQHGFRISLIDCLDRQHPAVSPKDKKSRPNGTGHFHKEPLEKPDCLKHIPRLYGRYGLPYEAVTVLLEQIERPDAIFVTSSMTYWYPGVVQMIGLIRSWFPGVPVALGGIYATLCREHAEAQSGADRVVAGGGESQVLPFLEEWTGFRSNPYDGTFLLPDYSQYASLDSAAILTSRGCPYDCPFCATHLLTGPHRRLDVESVIQLLRDVRGRGAKHVAFYDDALLIHRDKHIKPILESLIRQDLGLQFHTPNGIHPRKIDRDLAALMVQSGFKTIRLSYETSDPARQKKMGFKVSDADLSDAVSRLEKAGFKRRDLGAYVLMGLPEQPVQEVLDSMRFVFSLGIRVSLASFTPIPGTQSWDEAVQAGYFKQDVDPLMTNNSIFPLKSEDVPYESFVTLGTLAAQGNALIQRGVNPVDEDGFQGKMNRLRKDGVGGNQMAERKPS